MKLATIDSDVRLRPFKNRQEAGELLSLRLFDFKDRNPLVLGIPRGGVPIAKVVAEKLHGELDLLLVKKIGHPENPEFAVAAVSENGDVAINNEAKGTGYTHSELEARAIFKTEELRQKRIRYFGPGSMPIDPHFRHVIIVDDGIATGSTAAVAVQALIRYRPMSITVASPVATASAVDQIERLGAGIRVLTIPLQYDAYGFCVEHYYRDFSEVTDAEVQQILMSRTRR